MERTASFETLIQTAQIYLRACQTALDKEYQLFQWPRYDWHQKTRQLIFLEAGVAKVIADIQFVGSISTASATWLWSWANDFVDPQLAASMVTVRDYGAEHGFSHLTLKKWHAHEVDGWEVTAVAALLLKARGAYRSPNENGFTFMIMTDVRWAT